MSKRKGDAYRGASSIFDWRTFGKGTQPNATEQDIESANRLSEIQRRKLAADFEELNFIEKLHPDDRRRLSLLKDEDRKLELEKMRKTYLRRQVDNLLKRFGK